MLDHTGSHRMDYEEVLRSIGYFIDQNNIKEICILELKEGLLLRGNRYTADRGGYHTLSESYLFTNEDIEQMLEEAFQRRKAEQEKLQQQQAAESVQEPPKRGIFRLGE